MPAGKSTVLSKRPYHILVADDEAPIARALQLKLVHEGFEVTTARDGEEALACIKKEHFSLLILDLVMPRLDGFHVLQALHEAGSKMPVIVLSNLGQNVDTAKAKEFGAVEFFIKSDTSLTKIIETVEKYLA